MLQNLKVISCILICDCFDKGTVFMAAGLLWFERKEKVFNDKIKIKL